MIDTTTIRWTPARSPSSCRLRAEARKNSVAGSCSFDGHEAASTMHIHACQSLAQTLTGDHVHARRPGHRDDVVPGLLEYLDDMATDPSGRPGHRDLSCAPA